MAASDQAKRTVDAVFAQYGKVARYTSPSGTTLDCTAVIVNPDDAPVEPSGKARKEGISLELRRSEVAGPVRGAVVSLQDGSGRTFQIVGKPALDDDEQLVWECAVA